MKEWFGEYRLKIKNSSKEYGKIIFVFILFFINIIIIYGIISFIIPNKLKVSFLDVGQGDAIFVQTPSGKNMLIDGGGTNKILEKLNEEVGFFEKDIDVMIATHPDADHVTGLIPVLEKYNVKKIIISKAKSETGIFETLNKNIENENSEVYVADMGDVINFNDGVIVNILYPAKNYIAKKNDTNDASVSLQLNYGEESFLLTGDLPKERETQLITSKLSKNITVYKAGHHGSKTSSGEILLSYISPEYVIISAGKDNKYGHPNQETLEILQKYSKEILSTIDYGTISFVTDGRLMEINKDK